MEENLVYYFTGTGNSLQIANDIGKALSNSDVRKISEYKGDYINSGTLGIVFPVYCWGLPLIVVDFLKELNVSPDTYVYAVANFASMAGMALKQCQNILFEKNIKLSSGFLITMPSNYIPMFDATPEKKQKELFAKEFIKITEIAEIVRSRQETEIKKSGIIGLILYKMLYKGWASSFNTGDKDFTVSNACNGCQLCKLRCPAANITMTENKPVWNHNCQMCMACIQSCPEKAIDYQNKTRKRTRYINPNVKF